jgi:sugar lactone lactonase YvrE
MTAVSAISSARDRVGESPVWSVSAQALYWVDIEGQRIHCLDWVSRTQRSWALAERVGCIALSNRGTVIAAMESGIFEVELLEPPMVRVNCLAVVNHAQPDMRFNDGRCDAQGRLWVGTMVRNMGLGNAAGGIYCLDTEGLRGPELQGYITPNGMAFSPDGCTLYLSDSHPSVQMVWAFDYDPATGTPSNRRVFVDMNPLPGRPDGAAVDADGCYWVCGNDAGLIHRFTPAGRLDYSLTVPVKKPAMCAFGGAALDTLFVTSIRPDGIDLSDQVLAGGVFALRPGVCGLPEPVFSQFPVR